MFPARPFPSFHFLVFESEAKAIDMKMIFYSHANETHFHLKGFARSLVLNVTVFGISEMAYIAKALVVRNKFQHSKPLLSLVEGQ